MSSELNLHCKYDALVDAHLLKPYPKNRNSHPPDQITRLAKIIKYQGIRAPVIVDADDKKTILKGHGTRLAIMEAGGSHVPVVYQKFENEEQRYAFVQSDNAIASWSEIDFAGINLDIPDLGPEFDLEMLGIKDFELEPADKYGDKDADATPETRSTNIVIGDLFSLGSHRLLCGDSTDARQVSRLMNGEKADMVFTDPPYGMGAVENSGVLSKRYRPIEGDATPDLAKNAFKLFGSTPGIWWGANYFCSVLPDTSKWLVWDKNNGASDQTDCELAWTNLPGVVRQFTQASEKANRVHPTQKPVSLIEWAFGFHEGKNVFDPFLGSGSTLIACHKTGRRCFACEIDPHYVDVAIRRWETFSGEKAYRLNADGSKTAFSEIGQDE